jgi:hypothetical protein
MKGFWGGLQTTPYRVGCAWLWVRSAWAPCAATGSRQALLRKSFLKLFGACAAVACESAGDIECEFGPRTACAGGEIAVACEAAGAIECEFGTRTASAPGGTAVACGAVGDIEVAFGSRTASAGGGAAGVCAATGDIGCDPHTASVGADTVVACEAIQVTWNANSALAVPVVVLLQPARL